MAHVDRRIECATTLSVSFVRFGQCLQGVTASPIQRPDMRRAMFVIIAYKKVYYLFAVYQLRHPRLRFLKPQVKSLNSSLLPSRKK